MKTLIFNGSPHLAGETADLVGLLTKQLKGEYKIVNAYHSNISPCPDCRYCHENPGCCIDDEMQEIYEYLEDCDNIVIASPIYFSELTGKLLSVASRFQTYFCAVHFRKEKPSLKAKKGAVILTGGGSAGKGMKKAYETACELLCCVNCSDIHDPVSSDNTDIRPALEDDKAVNGIRAVAGYLNGCETG